MNQSPRQASDSQCATALSTIKYLLSAWAGPGVKEMCKTDPQDIFLILKKFKLIGN